MNLTLTKHDDLTMFVPSLSQANCTVDFAKLLYKLQRIPGPIVPGTLTYHFNHIYGSSPIDLARTNPANKFILGLKSIHEFAGSKSKDFPCLLGLQVGKSVIQYAKR